MSEFVGIDTGGTFTDFILYKNGTFVTYKIPSTPNAPEQAILAGLKHLNVNLETAHIIHGTTVATNALLEGKGAKTAFITNTGLKDILHIGRQTRDQLYSLSPQKTRQLFEKSLCFETAGRLQADGTELEPTSHSQIQVLKQTLKAQGVEAVAICMLFSFMDNRHESDIQELLKQDFFVTCSSRILPEPREYERAVVAWLNSYLSPVTQRYLQKMQANVSTPLHIMQSDATSLPAVQAGKTAVHLLLSGPAGGVLAATSISQNSPYKKLLTLDMGGTSTDVSLIDQQPSFTNEGQLAEFPLAIPMLDIHTIGAGGGSIARVDEAGRLHVGPESAGAVPGPACYGHGGQQATITDANVVLGRLPASRAWSGGLSLNMAAAEQAMEKIAHALNSSTRDAAVGIVQLANAHMAQALRVISIQRGYDPAEFNLLPFGGAAGLHMCAVARELGIRSIVVPVNSGILSAQGMLNAPAGQHVTQSLCALWSELTEHSVGQLIEKLRLRAVRQLESLKLSCTRTSQWLDMRYRGQSSTISLLWCEDLLTQFQREHEKRFGYCLSVELIELVTLKVWAYHDRPALQLEGVNQGMPAQAVDYVCLYEEDTPVPLYLRGQLVAGQAVIGPCIILDDAGTHYVEKLWRGRITPEGHIHLQMQEDCP